MADVTNTISGNKGITSVRNRNTTAGNTTVGNTIGSNLNLGRIATGALGMINPLISQYKSIKEADNVIGSLESQRLNQDAGYGLSEAKSAFLSYEPIKYKKVSDFGYDSNKSQLGIIPSTISGASMFSSPALQGAGAGIGFAAGVIGDALSFNKAVNETNEYNKAVKNINDYNYAVLDSNLNNTKTDLLYNSIYNSAANGGPINTNGNGIMSPFGKRFDTGGLAAHGANWTNGLITINNGSTHENNPNDGVQIGVDPQGTPNLVEEGEVVFNDYVFSNRLKVPKAVRKKYKLRDKKGLTFAEAAKEVSKESEERPNDPISKRGLEDWMTKLTNAQEEVRQAEAQKELIKQANALGVSPEELLAMQAQQAQGEQPVEQPTEMYPEMQGMPQGTIPMIGAYGGWKHGLGGNLFLYGGPPQYKLPGFDDFDKYWESLVDEGGTNHPNYGKIYKGVVGDWDANSEDDINKMGNPSIYAYNNLRRFWEKQPIQIQPWYQETKPTSIELTGNPVDWREKTKEYGNKFISKYSIPDSPAPAPKADIKYNEGITPEIAEWWNSLSRAQQLGAYYQYSGLENPVDLWRKDMVNADVNPSEWLTNPKTVEQYGMRPIIDAYKSSSGDGVFFPTDTKNPENSFRFLVGSVPSLRRNKATNTYTIKDIKKQPVDETVPVGEDWLTDLRYVPALGSALSVFSDLMGWSNKPDYSNADMIMNSARSIGNVRYNPIGDYMRYTPLDRLFYINQANANAAATRRALANTSGGNRGTAMAGILANDYNYINSLGQLARQAEEYNLAQREKVASFNRTTNMANAENDLKAQIANRENERLRIGATEAAAQMRDAIDARASAAKSANLTNLFDNIGNIGWEEFNRNMVNTSNPYYNQDRYGRVFWTKAGMALSKEERKRLIEQETNKQNSERDRRLVRGNYRYPWLTNFYTG